MKDIRSRCIVCKQIVDTTKHQAILISGKGVVHEGECSRFYDSVAMNESSEQPIETVQILM